MKEFFDARPAVTVPEPELHRLLGYPRHHDPGERSRELATEARAWFERHGRPWIYWREVALEISAATLRLDGVEFRSAKLLRHLGRSGAARALVVAVSAGPECETHAHQLWQDAKPDEYFFLETFGSAVVEQLIAAASGRICDAAAHEKFIAVPHYSPGYAGWDVADQTQLFALLTRGARQPLPGPLEVLSSGMLRPKKSLLAVVGLAPDSAAGRAALRATPCANCSLTPCAYRRAPYRHATASISTNASTLLATS